MDNSTPVYNMDLLPDEVLDMVFQYLTTPELIALCARVCRRWQHIVRNRALLLEERANIKNLHRGVRGVILSIIPINLCDMLNNIATRAGLLRELSVHANISFDRKHISALNLLPHLVHLDVFMRARILDEQMTPVVKRLRTFVANDSLAPKLLRELSAGSQLVALHMYGRAKFFSQRDLFTLLRDRAPYLQELTLRCTEMCDALYKAIGDCHALRDLRLYSCWMLTASGAAAVCRPPRLRVLHLTGARLVRKKALADMLAQLQHGLHELVLSNGWFGNDHVRLVAKRAPELRSIELWRCKLTPSGVEELAKSLQCLERLEVELILPQQTLHVLSQHPCLRRMFCLLKGEKGIYIDSLAVKPIQSTYVGKYFRPETDGYRASLYYFWTRNTPLKLMEPKSLQIQDFFYKYCDVIYTQG